MQFTESDIRDVVVYKLKKFADDRGWLAELFRHDDLAEEFHPVMSYISFTVPGVLDIISQLRREMVYSVVRMSMSIRPICFVFWGHRLSKCGCGTIGPIRPHLII